MPKPFVSIGIIFRDDIRCIERCLSSLAPLREALPCELVMADTGSVDGSREVAEQYADILFDFPWINDFAAARNAVMDRCTGRWYLSIDTDEWLDGDVKELVRFIRTNNKKAGEACSMYQRNYSSMSEDAEYRDFAAVRMLRMSTGVRYHGAIHESWGYTDGRPLRTSPLTKTVLHHDGYVNLGTEAGMAKRNRNMELLEKELEQDPENLRRLLQAIESSRGDEETMEYIRRGLAATEAKRDRWQRYGPVIYRTAVAMAKSQKLEELEEWAARAEELFPKSFFTLLDVYYVMFTYHWETTKNYEECARLGEGYLRAMKDYHAGKGDQGAISVSTLRHATPSWERGMQTVLANVYLRLGQPERTAELLGTVEFSLLNGTHTANCVLVLKELHRDTDLDTAPLVRRLYEEICKPTPSEKRAEERKNMFNRVAASLFASLEEEEKSEAFTRWSCAMLAPLAGQHGLGDAAAVLAAETAGEKERLLAAADKPYAIPREILRRAILSGISFPLREKPMSLEEMGTLALALAKKDGLGVLERAVECIDAGSQQLAWAMSIVVAVAGTWEWTEHRQSMDLARTFAQVEEIFLSCCYAPDMLCEENILLLPSTHRFGWYCGRAFQALDSGNSSGYIQLLRTGVEGCPKMKNMVKYLAKNTPELQNPSRELLELADKVRTLLAAYDPEDPAVAALKQSPIYQEVAHLIEGIDVPVMGGLPS